MSARAKSRNDIAAHDLSVLAGRIESQKVALDAVNLKLGQQARELKAAREEVTDLRSRLAVVEELVRAPRP